MHTVTTPTPERAAYGSIESYAEMVLAAGELVRAELAGATA